MKSIAVPKFSERYQAHVDAERQYVFGSRQEARLAGKEEGRASIAGGTGVPASRSSIEAAFRLARMQNTRSDAASSS